MSLSQLLGLNRFAPRPDNTQRTEYVYLHQPLRRILAFTGQSIDDVVNSRISKNKVTGYYKLYRQIHRRSEIVELENQWNA